jgi:pilus assembly protein CpaF
MSFAIIISEKGGQERREVFDKNEISIGRVQGNDLLLPKGNVSKRHARIVFRDGRFIVTDLKSTNGSYVNGHRIAQATIVREGDKIYIGDFILKVDAGSSGSGPLPSPRDGQRPVDSDAPAMLRDPDASGATPAPRISQMSSNEGSAVSHIPLEHDPDDPSTTGMPIVNPRTGLAGESRPPRMGGSTQASGSIDRTVGVDRGGFDRTDPRQEKRTTLGGAQPPGQLPPPPPAAARPAMAPAAGGQGVVQPSRPATSRPKDGPARGGHSGALASLAQRLADVVDLDEGDSFAPASDQKRTSIERVLREQARALQQEGEVPSGLNVDDLVREATREALGTGPLAELLDDDEVVEVQIARFDQIMVVRESGAAPLDVGFSSEHALRRSIGRLALAAGHRIKENETTLGLRLPSGAQMTAIFPPVAANGSTVVIRKRRRADLGLEDLVRSGTLSRGMAVFLQQCLAAKANILVAGPLGAGTTTLIGALAAAGALEERTIAIQEIDELVLTQPYGASLVVPDVGEAGARILRMAASLRPDRLLVGAMTGHIVGQVVDAIGGGLDGVIAALRGPTLRQSLARLVPALISSHPGLDPASARSWLAASFDVAVEVTRLKSGRHRVLRIAELTSGDGPEIKTRDVFEFTLDPAGAERGEGVFNPSGVVPAVVQELKAHGHRVDESIFRKGAR